jgi:hypothetical protein
MLRQQRKLFRQQLGGVDGGRRKGGSLMAERFANSMPETRRQRRRHDLQQQGVHVTDAYLAVCTVVRDEPLLLME